MVQMLTTQTNKETHCKCSQHNQINCICSAFLFWLCCEHLQRVCCQIDESCFLNLQVFFFYLQRVSFFGCVVSICSVCFVKLTKVVFLICRCFFLFAARFFFWLCCEHLQRVRCQIDESVFLICRCFFLFAVRWALSATVPLVKIDFHIAHIGSCISLFHVGQQMSK